MYSKQYIYALQLMHCTRNQNDKQTYILEESSFKPTKFWELEN